MITAKSLAEYNKDNNKEVNLLLVSWEDVIKGAIKSEELTVICLRWSYHYALRDFGYKPLPEETQQVRYFNSLKESQCKKVFAEDSGLRQDVLSFRGRYMSIKYGNKVKLSPCINF